MLCVKVDSSAESLAVDLLKKLQLRLVLWLLLPLWDSRILEIESWLFKPCKEDKTCGLSTKRGDEIHDSSPKAESLLSRPPPLRSFSKHP